MSSVDMRKTVGAIGIAVAIAGIGGAAITAASTSGGHGFMDGGMHAPGGPPTAEHSGHRADGKPPPAPPAG